MAPRHPGRWLAVAAALAVASAVTLALTLIDGPDAQRDKRFDRQRLDDLHRLAGAIDCYWARHDGRLPGDLAALRPDRLDLYPSSCYATAARDPQSGEPYAYRPLQDGDYELCARFARAADPKGTEQPPLRAHGAGIECFRQTAKRPR